MGLIYKTGRLYGGGGGADYVELTQAQYDALPSTQKMDGTMYLITDGGGAGNGSATYYGISEPSSSLGQDGDMYILYDDTNNTITTIYIKIEGDWLPAPSGSSGGGSISYRRFTPTENVSSTSTITITVNEV